MSETNTEAMTLDQREFLASEQGRMVVHVIEYEIANKYGLTNPVAERIALGLHFTDLLREAS